MGLQELRRARLPLSGGCSTIRRRGTCSDFFRSARRSTGSTRCRAAIRRNSSTYIEADDARIATTALLRSKGGKDAAATAKWEKEAAEGAAKYLPLIRKNADASWADGFYEWRDKYEFTAAAKPVMKAFYKLRAEQEEPAKKLVNEGRTAMNQRRPDDAWPKYEEVVAKYPASSQYRMVKGWIENRK